MRSCSVWLATNWCRPFWLIANRAVEQFSSSCYVQPHLFSAAFGWGSWLYGFLSNCFHWPLNKWSWAVEQSLILWSDEESQLTLTHTHTQTQRTVFLTKHGKQPAELVYRLVALACCHAKCCSACSGICSTVQTKLLDKRYNRRACGTKKHGFGSIRTHSRGSCLCRILRMSPPSWRSSWDSWLVRNIVTFCRGLHSDSRRQRVPFARPAPSGAGQLTVVAGGDVPRAVQGRASAAAVDSMWVSTFKVVALRGLCLHWTRICRSDA